MFTIKNNSKRIIATIVLMAMMLIIPISFYQPVKADGDGTSEKTSVASIQDGEKLNDSGTGEYSLDGLGQKAERAITDVQKTVVGIALPLGSLIIIILLVCTIVSHDERKISGYIKTIAIILAALVLILIVNAGAVADLVKNLTGLSFGK